MRLKPWLIHALFPCLITLGVVAVYHLLHLLSGRSSNSETYFFSLSFFLLSALQLSIYRAVLPLAVSFSSTRKEALIGLRLYRIAATALCAAATALIFQFKGDHNSIAPSAILISCFGLYLIGSSLGGVMGITSIKFGNVGAGAVFLVFFFVLFLLSSICMIFMLDSDVIRFTDHVQYVVLAIGIAVHLLMGILDKKTVYRYTVKL